MTVFIATYPYGTYDCVVVANTRMEALGFLLESFPETEAIDWCLDEIDVAKVGVYY